MTKVQQIPAFPSGMYMNDGGEAEEVLPIHEGMELRDYFAIHAPTDALALPSETLIGVCEYLGEVPNNRTSIMPRNWRNRVQAKARYRFADAMMEARKRQS